MELARDSKHRFCEPSSVTSGVLHFWGMLLASAGTVVLLVLAARRGADPWKMVSFSVYGGSLVLLYGASAAFHTFYISDRVHRTLRKIDHCMIYLLIAGSYTPLCLVPLRGPVGWTLLVIVWSLTIVGIIVKLFWIDGPMWASSALYLLIGWIAVVFLAPLQNTMGRPAVGWLVAGGILFTAGAVLYAAKTLHFETKYFGSHELFHIVILAGTACHFYMVYKYIL